MSGIIEFAFNNVPYSSKVKKEGIDQELIQSKPTTYPQSQKEKKHIHKLINVHERCIQ